MIEEKHLTIHGVEVKITSTLECGRMILKAHNRITGKIILCGNYDPNTKYLDNHITRFIGNLMELLKDRRLHLTFS